MPKPAAVDLEHLGRYTGGDAALNAEVLELFCSQAQEIVHALEKAHGDEDVKSWREYAHALKGAARGIGAFELADLAAALEREAAGTRAAAARLRALAGEAQQVAGFVGHYLQA